MLRHPATYKHTTRLSSCREVEPLGRENSLAKESFGLIDTVMKSCHPVTDKTQYKQACLHALTTDSQVLTSSAIFVDFVAA